MELDSVLVKGGMDKENVILYIFILELCITLYVIYNIHIIPSILHIYKYNSAIKKNPCLLLENGGTRNQHSKWKKWASEKHASHLSQMETFLNDLKMKGMI